MWNYDEIKLKQDNAANLNRKYQQCSISLMDTIADPDISFDEKGISNYYYEYIKVENEKVHTEESLSPIINRIKIDGKGKAYDCIMGLSGGVDSTYVALQAKRLGLRPLCIHFDNGWNSELAVKNIENIVSKLGFDLYTYVINWEEFRDMQIAFFKAHVIDIEALTDHAISGSLYKIAAKHNVKYIISGTNVVTEATLPKSWIFKDPVNITNIHKKYGSMPLKTYPFFYKKDGRYFRDILKIKVVEILNYLPYNKLEAKKAITEQLEWRDYGGKHYESVFTRFYQGYILPNKFSVDKRKAHFSDLIFSGQITKEQALQELKKPIYDTKVMEEDKAFFLKKLGFSEAFFAEYINSPAVPHERYGFTTSLFDQYPILKIFKNIKRLF